MGSFKKFDKGRDRTGFGAKKFGGDKTGVARRFDERGPAKELHSATCSQCKQTCEVPFKPAGNLPVFCSVCYKSNGGTTDTFVRKSFDGNGVTNTGSTITSSQFETLNAKLDKILGLLASGKERSAERVLLPRGERFEAKIEKKIARVAPLAMRKFSTKRK